MENIYAYIDIAFNAKKMEIRELENLKVLEGKIQRMKSIENFMMKKQFKESKILKL